MRLTVDIIPHEGSEEEPELYYKVLAERIGRHVAEIVSLGNMDEGIVAHIYRAIADAIDAGLLDRRIVSDDVGARVVKDGFMKAIGEPSVAYGSVNEASTLGASEVAERSNRSLQVQALWSDLDGIRERDRIRLIVDQIDGLDLKTSSITDAVQQASSLLNSLVAVMSLAMTKVEKVAATHGCRIVEDMTAALLADDGCFDAKHHWEVSDQEFRNPLIAWADVIDFDMSRYGYGSRLRQLLDALVLQRQREAFKSLAGLLAQLPSFSIKDIERKLTAPDQVFDELDGFTSWVEDELERGLPHMMIKNRIKDDFPALAEYSHQLASGVESMFPDRAVVRKQRSGRLTFYWGDRQA